MCDALPACGASHADWWSVQYGRWAPQCLIHHDEGPVCQLRCAENDWCCWTNTAQDCNAQGSYPTWITFFIALPPPAPTTTVFSVFVSISCVLSFKLEFKCKVSSSCVLCYWCLMFFVLRYGLILPPWGSIHMGSTSWPSWRSTTWRMGLTWAHSVLRPTASCKLFPFIFWCACARVYVWRLETLVWDHCKPFP